MIFKKLIKRINPIKKISIFKKDVFYNQDKLFKFDDNLNHQYQNNKPFPHIILDNFFEPKILENVIKEIPTPFSKEKLINRDIKNLQENKFAFRDTRKFGPYTQHLLYNLNSKNFLEFLTHLTGIKGILPDPYLMGAGFH